jgi:hypothetical protein
MTVGKDGLHDNVMTALQDAAVESAVHPILPVICRSRRDMHKTASLAERSVRQLRRFRRESHRHHTVPQSQPT